MKADLIEEMELPVVDVDLPPRRVVASFNYVRRELRAASHSILSLFDQAIVSATAFFTAAIIGRMTSPSELGLYYTTLAIILLVVGIQEQIISVPYMFFAKRFEGRQHAEYAGSVWLHHAALTAVTMVGLLGAIVFFTLQGSTSLLPGLWALLVAVPLILFREEVRRFAFADLHIGTAITMDVVVSVAQVAGLLALGYFGELTLFAIFGVMGGSCALSVVVWLVLRPAQVEFRPERFRSDWKHNWAFGKWALRGYMLNSSIPYLMIWLVNFAIGPAAAGILGACSSLVGITRVIQSGITNVLTTQASYAFSSGGWPALQRLLLRNTLFLGVTLGGICLVFVATGDYLATLVYGDLYHGAGPTLIALALATLMSGFSVVAGNGLWAIDRARSNFIADICCAVGMIASAAVLVMPLGAFGAALATLIGNTAATVVRVAILLRAWQSDLESGHRAVREGATG